MERTKWFYTEFKEDTKAVVLLAHGLNLLPSKMDQLASFFNSKKCDVLRISLGENPNKWIENFSDDYDSAIEHARILERPLYLVGFSLGALMGVHFMLRHHDQQFSKIALIAPATHTHFYTAIPAFLAHFFPNFGLPSFNLPEYRQRSSTKLAEYKKMHSLQKEVNQLLKTSSINCPTLLIYNALDELVSSKKLMNFAKVHSNWTTQEISNRTSLLPKKYHHLMIDLAALGLEDWNKLTSSLDEHFSL